MRQNCEEDGNMEGDIVHGLSWTMHVQGGDRAALRRGIEEGVDRREGRAGAGAGASVPYATMRCVDVSRLGNIITKGQSRYI